MGHRHLHSFPTRRSSDLGTNLDDLKDHRPGLKAAKQYAIRHPLVEAEMTKDDIRRLRDRKSTRLNSSHVEISYAVFCLKKKKQEKHTQTHNYTTDPQQS